MEGLSAEHGPAHLMRAAEEGSIFEVRLGIDALRAGGTTVSRVILAEPGHLGTHHTIACQCLGDAGRA